MTRALVARLGAFGRRPNVGMVASTGFSVGTKAVQAIAAFATVHRLVQLWDLSGYGLWVTLTAFALYISLFDLGVGYGVKNRISEAWGRGDVTEAAGVVRAGGAVYVLASLAALASGLLVVPLVAPFKHHVVAAGLLWAACVISFLLSLNSLVLAALGRFKTLALLSLVAPCSWFCILQAWPRGSALGLETAAAIYGSTMILQAVVITVTARRALGFRVDAWFRTTLAELMPLLRTGAKFLALQMATFALNGCGSFIVYRALGGVETAQYDAANKVFSVFTIAFSTLIAIAWTEISRAKAASDYARIAGVHRLLHLLALAFVAAASLACWFSEPLTKALTGIRVPSSSTAAFVVFIALQILAFTSAVFLNAFERLRGQIIAAIVSIPVFFGVAQLLLSRGVGMPSLPLASACAMLPSLVVCFVIARRLVASTRPAADAGRARP